MENKKTSLQRYQEALLKESLKKDQSLQTTFLQNRFEESDNVADMLQALRAVAQAKGFKDFAERAELNRENLYRALSDNGNPRLDTLFKIVDALGYKLSVKQKY